MSYNSNTHWLKQFTIMLHSFEDFCSKTSLHGWGFLHTSIAIRDKILWGFVIVASFTAAILLIKGSEENCTNIIVVSMVVKCTYLVKNAFSISNLKT